MPKPATGKKNHAKTEARLGICWLVDGKLLIDSAPLSECEHYGDHLNYPGSHIRVWEGWQQVGKAPAETEYEEYARGRVLCDKQGKKFTLLADTCILKQKHLIATIKKELHLPKQTSLGTDPHYRCFHCLHGNADDEE
ncbi:MAG: hypothetical protein LAN83_08985 [Acidobacteriia bacterium]|nr:hypothetical protein [Terriglobia bacterium]